jgi:hypothetical protein
MKAVSPVIEGLESEEIEVAKHQPEYQVLPMLRGEDGYSICRFYVDDKDLENIKKTRSIWIYMLVGSGPVTPISVESNHPIPAEQRLIDE